LKEESDGSEGYEVEAMDFEISEHDTGLHHNIHEIGDFVHSPAPAMTIGGQAVPSPLAPYMIRKIQNSLQVSNDSKRIEDGNATLLQTRLNAVNEVMCHFKFCHRFYYSMAFRFFIPA
jgi:hypothetical protein